MRKSRFTEGQIVGILKALKAGAKSASLSRKYGISETTLYNWRAKYGGLEVSDLVKLRQLEDENRRLKKIVADQALNIEALKIVAEGNLYARGHRGDAVELHPASGRRGNGYPVGKLRPTRACLEDADPFPSCSGRSDSI